MCAHAAASHRRARATRGHTQIVALASISLRGARSDLKERDAILTLLQRVRTRPYLRDAPVIVMCESAPGIAASHICRYLENEPNLCYMFESTGGKEGVPKSNE